MPLPCTFRKTLFLAALLSLTIERSHAELAPDLAPGGNFALENWRLDFPVEIGSDGIASIQPAQLSGPNGFVYAPYFYTTSDGAMTMWTPVNGATAGGSSHPRNELREMIDPGNHEVNWTSSGNSILDAQLRILQVPSDGILIVGQVHGFDAAPLVLVYYRYDAAKQTGKLMTKLQGTPVLGPPYTQHTIATDIKLGQTFTYQIKVERQPGGPATVSVSANSGIPAQMVMDSSWDGVGMYFKAGSYLHISGTSSSEGGLVKFYRLATSHPANGLLIRTASKLPNARANTPYSIQLAFSGGVGGGTWSLVSGFPPSGLALDPQGLISGTPTSGAISTKDNDFMVRVRDANGSTYSKKLSILVNP
nr:polysaccharide lyase family 7 protein [uncultured Pseudomonas sp.]